MKSTFTSMQVQAKTPLSAGSRAEERFLEVQGVRVGYAEAGSHNAGTPLIMLHGYNGSFECWYPYTMRDLGAERRVIAPDLPGNGLSGRLGEHTLESYAEFVVALMDALGVEQADLLGHSMGGQVAIATAWRFPERFRRLVLVDSSGLPELVRPQWLAPIRMLSDSCMRHVRLYPMYVRIGLRARAAREGLYLLRRKSISRHLKSVLAPTLIIWGSRDRVVPLEHGAFMARHIPSARLAVIRGAGHMPFYQKPEEFKRLVLAFLRR